MSNLQPSGTSDRGTAPPTKLVSLIDNNKSSGLLIHQRVGVLFICTSYIRGIRTVSYQQITYYKSVRSRYGFERQVACSTDYLHGRREPSDVWSRRDRERWPSQKTSSAIQCYATATGSFPSLLTFGTLYLRFIGSRIVGRPWLRLPRLPSSNQLAYSCSATDSIH